MEDVYVAQTLDLPGVYARGRSRAEALRLLAGEVAREVGPDPGKVNTMPVGR